MENISLIYSLGSYRDCYFYKYEYERVLQAVVVKAFDLQLGLDDLLFMLSKSGHEISVFCVVV